MFWLARGDEELIKLLEHDVQFYEEQEQSLEEWMLGLRKAFGIHLRHTAYTSITSYIKAIDGGIVEC